MAEQVGVEARGPRDAALEERGLQSVYGLLNGFDGVVCERVFLPEDGASAAGRLTILESGRPVAEADSVAFSISFESDYPHLLALLERAKIPLLASQRTERHPLVTAGGVACFLNPEPISPFVDAFLIGEAEVILPHFVEVFRAGAERQALLMAIARTVPGAYVPAFYRVTYTPAGTIDAFEPTADLPARIPRPFVRDLSRTATCSVRYAAHY